MACYHLLYHKVVSAHSVSTGAVISQPLMHVAALLDLTRLSDVSCVQVARWPIGSNLADTLACGTKVS